MTGTREPSIGAFHDAPVYFRYGSNKRRVLIDALTASAVLACYNAASPGNRAKLARMVSGSPEQLDRVISFCWKHVRIGAPQ